jgi:hypothetical protein
VTLIALENDLYHPFVWNIVVNTLYHDINDREVCLNLKSLLTDEKLDAFFERLDKFYDKR